MRLPQRLETLLPEFGRIPQPGRKRERDAPSPGGSSKANGQGLQSFLDEISLDREREEDPKEAADGVTLITLHAAKGLEFAHVFLIGVEDGLLPHERSKAEGSIDEERRLFYVGMTRAMRSLVITWCRSRKKFGKAVFCRPSPFLQEIRGAPGRRRKL